jgi:pseudomonalisin
MRKLLAAAAMSAVAASCASHGGGTPAVPQTGAQGAARAESTVTQSVPTGWAATATKATVLSGSTDLGAVAPSQPLTIRAGLALRNLSSLKSAVANSQTVSFSTFMADYAPAATQLSAVKTYLASKGFTNITAEPNNLIVSATGTAAQAQSAFDTTLHRFSFNGQTFYSNTTPAYVPSSLNGVVVAVLGLNNYQAAKTPTHVTPCTGGVTNPCLRFYDPITFRHAYDARGLTGIYTNVAVMAEGNVQPSITDLRTNESKFGMPVIPVYVKQVGLQSPDTAGDLEWTLDMTSSSGIAWYVKAIYLYDTTSLTDSDIALEYNHWVTDDLAKLGNSSFGECEAFPYIDGSMLIDDEVMLEGASQGQTMFASSGDTGAFCSVGTPNGVPAGAPFVSYPAASPYIVAVGGTDLYSNTNGYYQGESGWESGGGGLSQFEYSPYWESYAQPVSANGLSYRGVPDVAMDASLETGALLWSGGSEYIVGGTSLASPLAMGSYAIMQSNHSNALGFGAPRFYRIYQLYPTAGPVQAGPPPTEMVGGFHDILSGCNPLYCALPKYDYITGLGSFDIYQTVLDIGK